MEKGTRLNNLEPPPSLLNAVTIFIGRAGYIQIGYQPELIEDDDPEFHHRIVIVMGETWLIMDIEECNNFFISLRKRDEFRYIEGSHPYLPNDDPEFPGTFFLDKYYEKRVSTYVNYHTQKEYEIIFPNDEAIKKIVSLEDIVLGHVYELFHLREQFTGEMGVALEKAAKECHNVSHLKFLAAHTSDKIVVELATNFFSFFCSYWQQLKKN